MNYQNSKNSQNNPSNVVHVCAWCPDKEERTKRSQDEGKTVSNGVCEECAENVFPE